MAPLLPQGRLTLYTSQQYTQLGPRITPVSLELGLSCFPQWARGRILLKTLESRTFLSNRAFCDVGSILYVAHYKSIH